MWGWGLLTDRVYNSLSALRCRPFLIIIIRIIIIVSLTSICLQVATHACAYCYTPASGNICAEDDVYSVQPRAPHLRAVRARLKVPGIDHTHGRRHTCMRAHHMHGRRHICMRAHHMHGRRHTCMRAHHMHGRRHTCMKAHHMHGRRHTCMKADTGIC